MNGAPEVDAIVVNWNGRAYTPAAIDSLLALSELRADPAFLRIVVVDNGSTDDSVKVLRDRYGDRIRIVENGENLGFGGGANRGIDQTSAPYIFLMNSDAAVHDGAIAALLDFMKTHERCAIAGPKIFDLDGSIAQSCGEFDTWVGAFLRSSAWGELPVLREYANGAALRQWDYDSARQVDLVIAAAMMMRRTVIAQIGGFDPRFFMYHEDVDLAKRVADAGYETWFVPDARVTHAGMGSTGGENVERWKTESRRMYWIKYHGLTWYYALSAALVARYALYAAILSGAAFAVKRLLP